MENLKILQIIPTGNEWFAVFKIDDRYELAPLAVWALVEVNNVQIVYGMITIDSHLKFPHTDKNFILNAHKSDLHLYNFEVLP